MQVMQGAQGGCDTVVAAITRGIPRCLGGGVNGVCQFKGGGVALTGTMPFGGPVRAPAPSSV